MAGCKNQSSIGSSLQSGEIISNSSKAEAFCNFFANVGNSLESELPPGQSRQSYGFYNPNSFYFSPVSEEEIVNIIGNLKNVKSWKGLLEIYPCYLCNQPWNQCFSMDLGCCTDSLHFVTFSVIPHLHLIRNISMMDKSIFSYRAPEWRGINNLYKDIFHINIGL